MDLEEIVSIKGRRPAEKRSAECRDQFLISILLYGYHYDTGWCPIGNAIGWALLPKRRR
jgi:hypothetical protein